MSSVTPQTLPSVDSSSYWDRTEYRWRSSDTNKEIYDYWNLNNNAWERSDDNLAIYVDTVTNTWHDFGAGHPFNVATDTNDVVTLSSSGVPNLYKFQKPTTASWISSGGSGGGGTTTEGTGDPVPVGSKYFNNLDQLVFVVGSSSPTSDADIVYKIFRGQDRYNMTQVFVLSHTNGSDTEYNVGDPSSFKRWELRLESNDVQYDSQILVDYPARKVSCNFW